MKGRKVACVLMALAIATVFFQGVACAAEWKLSFIERDTKPWVRGAATTDSSAKLYILVDNTVVKTYSTIGTDYHYGQETIDLSAYLSEGKTVTLAFYGTSTSFLLYNLSLTIDGKNAVFTPWSVSKTPSHRIFHDYSIREDRLVATINSAGWVNITTSPVSFGPELEIPQSGITTSKDIWDIEDSDSIDVTVSVRNTGASQESGAAVKLYVNDELYQTSASSPIASGSSHDYVFPLVADFGSGHSIKLTAQIIPSTGSGMEFNDVTTKYILKHPYFYTTDFATTPANVYVGQEPYTTWLSSLCTTANSGLVTNFRTYPYEYVKSGYTEAMALCGNLNGGDNYKNKTMEALMSAGILWTFANRTNAGDTSEGSGGLPTVYPVNYSCGESCQPPYSAAGSTWGQVLIQYSLAYDWNFNYMKEYDETHGTNYLGTIRDNLAHLCQDGYLLAKELYTYPSGADMDTAYVWGDWGLGKIAMTPGVGVCAMALLDYDGQYQDVERFDEAVDFVRDDMFTENFLACGAPEGMLAIQTTEGGLWEEGSGYRDYQEPVLSYFMALYKSTYGVNLADYYPLAYGYSTSALLGAAPHGRYPQNLGATSYAGAWWPNINYMHMYAITDPEYGLFNFYINGTLAQDYGYRGQDSAGKNTGGGDFGAYEGLLVYDASAIDPSGITSYFDPYGTYAIMRTGFGKDDQVFTIMAPRNHTMSGHSAGYVSQLNFDYWAKGAFLFGHSGDERYLDALSQQRFGVARQTIAIDCPTCTYKAKWQPMDRDTKGTYGNMKNPSRITDYMDSELVDFVQGNVNISAYGNDSRGDAFYGNLPSNITWERSALLSDYLVVFDKVTTNGSTWNIGMVDNPMSASAWNSTPAGSSVSYGSFSWDNLSVNGQNVDWYNRTENPAFFITSVHQNVYNATWHTRAEVNTVETSFRPVNGTVSYNPMLVSLQVDPSSAHYGTYNFPYEYYKPVLIANQSGSDMKWIRVYYAVATGDTNAVMSNLAAIGSSGNDYATRIVLGTNTDIVTFSDGESITAGDVTTDAVISFSRMTGSTLSYFFVRDGTTFSYGGSQKLSVSSGSPDLVLVVYDGDDVDVKVSGSGSTTFKVSGLKAYNTYGVKRDGSSYSGSHWDIVDGGAAVEITTSLSEHTFEIYVTEEGEAPPDEDPPDMVFVTPSANNTYTNNENYLYISATGGELLSSCILQNATANITMSINGFTCYYDMTGQVNQTQLDFRVFGTDTAGNVNVTVWRRATIYLGDNPPIGGDELPVEENPSGGRTPGGGVSGSCTVSWSCGDWSACSGGLRTRTCTDGNDCGTLEGKPVDSIQCCSKLDVLLYPLSIKINNGTVTNFVVSADTNCDTSDIGLLLGGVGDDWYSVNRLPEETPGVLRFNVSINVPSDASGVYTVSYRLTNSLIQSQAYNSTVSVISPRTEERTPEIDASILPAPDIWLIAEIVMAIVLGIMIVVLMRVYVAY